MDTWGWQLHDGAAGKSTVIKGLVYGPAIGHLLTGSGKIHVDLRFFLDPLKWEDTPWDSKPFLTWVERKYGESDVDYAARAARLAVTHGVAHGWRQLGLRSKNAPEDQPTNTPKVWTLKSVPRFWDGNQVTSFFFFFFHCCQF